MKRHMFSHVATVGAALLLATAALPASTHSQQDREELVYSGIDAYLSFLPDSAVAYLTAAIDPSRGEPDELWALAVQYLTQTLLDEGETDFANVWMRWAVRHFGEMGIDSTEFDDPQRLFTTYFAAIGAVSTEQAQDTATQTSWEWPVLGSRERSGALRVSPSSQGVSVAVELFGRGSVQTGQVMSLPPGTYSLRATAAGYNQVDVIREILPGVTSVLSFTLEPIFVAPEVVASPDVLPDGIEATVRNQVARFSVSRFRTDPTCGTGFFAGRDGLLLTTYTAIRGAEALAVELADGSSMSEDITVAAWDTESNVAVLKLPVSRTDSLLLTSELSDEQWTWAFGNPGCGATTVGRLQITSSPDRPTGLIQLSDSIESGEQGGPLITQTGTVIGLAIGPLRAVPADRLASSLETARRNVREDRLVDLRTVAERENHLYGSVMIQSTLNNAIAHITPLESWQWPDTEQTGAVPLTYNGPTGRYRLDLQAAGQEPHRAEFTVDPGAFKEITEPQIIAVDGGGGGFPWPIALLGAAGAAVAGVLILGGSDDQPVTTDRGSVVVILPHRR